MPVDCSSAPLTTFYIEYICDEALLDVSVYANEDYLWFFSYANNVLALHTMCTMISHSSTPTFKCMFVCNKIGHITPTNVCKRCLVYKVTVPS